MDSDSCNHSNVYFGVTNIRYQNRTIGAIDAWRCVKCKKIFAEEKQLGILDLSPEIGMPEIGSEERWAILVCAYKKFKDRWALVKVKKDGKLKHQCDEHDIDLDIENYSVKDDKHWVFMLEDNINKEVEID